MIIVDGPRTDCYTALGTLHSMWRPVPGRFKDFIASPKNNLYRSLHTTVIGPDDQPVEVLIRTVEMHHVAEFGIAANFRDPQAAARLDTAARAEQLAWLRRVLDWQHVVDDAHKFLDALRCDLADAQIQVFTSGGKAVLLPVDATPVDVAYTLGRRPRTLVRRRHPQQPADPALVDPERRRRGRHHHPGPGPGTARPVPGVARLRQVAAGAAGDHPLVPDPLSAAGVGGAPRPARVRPRSGWRSARRAAAWPTTLRCGCSPSSWTTPTSMRCWSPSPTTAPPRTRWSRG